MAQTTSDNLTPLPNVSVREAVRDDVSEILEIYNWAVLNSTATADYQTQTLEYRLRWFEGRVAQGYPVFVAEQASRVIGWSSYGPYHTRYGYRYTVENSVYVHHDHYRKGAGRMLLHAIIQHARLHGYHAMIASIDSANTASIELHAALGFERVALMKELIYKFDRWLDVAYMELLL